MPAQRLRRMRLLRASKRQHLVGWLLINLFPYIIQIISASTIGVILIYMGVCTYIRAKLNTYVLGELGKEVSSPSTKKDVGHLGAP